MSQAQNVIATFNIVSGGGGSCTPGTNCYCDKVKPGGIFADALLLFCEDFDAVTLRVNQGTGNGAPYYGPPPDSTGQPGNAGHNAYWTKVSIDTVQQIHAYRNQQGPCTFDQCDGPKMWTSDNRWNVNQFSPGLAIYEKNSDFTAEIGTLTVPTNAAGGGVGVFNGNGSLAWRIPPLYVGGFAGGRGFPTATEIGMTWAGAYPNNVDASNIYNQSWKGNEWRSVPHSGGGYDGLFSFGLQQACAGQRPLSGGIWAFGPNGNGGNYTTHPTATVGTAMNANGNNFCGSVNALNGPGDGIWFWADATLFQQSRDWPRGTWACIQAHVQITGGTLRHRIWFTPSAGPNVGTTLLVSDFTAPMTGLDAQQGWDAMFPNDYVNQNQFGATTNNLTFRYEDSWHARRGLPVSCAQIGFI